MWTNILLSALTKTDQSVWQKDVSKTRATFLFFLLTISHLSYATSVLKKHTTEIEINNKTEICLKNPIKVSFNIQTIFDKNQANFTFLHRWANAIHMDTRLLTLENETAFFLKRCNKSIADIAEMERYLRSRSYLRDAKVVYNKAIEEITVTTWDNWSLMPTISLGRQGGENTYSLGIKERNLMGLGINTDIASYQNNQRSGYKIVSIIPLFQKNNTDIKLRFSRNDDGHQHAFFIKKSFAGFHIKNAYLLGFNNELRNDTTFQNDSIQSIFTHKISYKEANYAWLNLNTEHSVLRYTLGITQDQHIFSLLSPAALLDQKVPLIRAQRPQDRNFIYPWAAVEYIEKDFRKLTNVHLISQVEDFNYGWQMNSRLGLSDGNRDNSAWALWKLQVKKGIQINNNSLMLLDLSLEGNIYQEQNNRLLIKLNAEYFYHLNRHWVLYLNNTHIFSENQYLDRPVTIGGSGGLRGFPLQYQHGKNSVKLTSEIRYYPQLNILKLFDLAGVAFFDIGRAFGGSLVPNSEDNLLTSAGIGLRAYSPHSSGNHPIIHLDLAFPRSQNSAINIAEIRVQVKKSF